MTTEVNTIARSNIRLDQDAPAAFGFRIKDGAGTYETRDASLICVITDGATTLNKAVSDGITLSDYGGVTNAYAELQLTPAEAASLRSGAFTRYEFREGTTTPTLKLKGRLILE